MNKVDDSYDLMESEIVARPCHGMSQWEDGYQLFYLPGVINRRMRNTVALSIRDKWFPDCEMPLFAVGKGYKIEWIFDDKQESVNFIKDKIEE